MRRLSGVSLVEILIALAVLGALIPVSLNAFATTFTAAVRIHERVEKAAGAEWWFNQLSFPTHISELNGAPRRHGRMSFAWETRAGPHNTLHITLRVTNGSPSDVPFTESRFY